MNTNVATTRVSIVKPGNRNIAASSLLTTMTDVKLKPASSGRVTPPTLLTHFLTRASAALSLVLGPVSGPVTPPSSVRERLPIGGGQRSGASGRTESPIAAPSTRID